MKSIKPFILPASSLILLCIVIGWYVAHSGSGYSIKIGERKSGVLRESDPIRKDIPHGAQNSWGFSGLAGQKITIAAESFELDTYLSLLDPAGRQVAWSDGSGGLVGPRIQVELPATGRYTAAVCGANADQFGTYWISLIDGEQDSDWTQSGIEALYQRGMDWANQHGSARAISWLKVGMGRYLKERGQFAEADRYYAEDLANAQKFHLTYAEWAARLERGRLLVTRVRYADAIGEIRSALQVSKTLSSVADAEGPVLVELGNLFRQTKRSGLAKICFQAGISLAEQSGQPATLADEYSSLSAVIGEEDPQKAIHYADQAYRLSPGLNPILALKAKFAAAATRLLMQTGRVEEGMTLANEARETAKRLGFIDEEISLTTLVSMGFYRLKQTDRMVHSAHEALELTKTDDEDPTSRRVALQLEADGEMLRGDFSSAYQDCMEALQTLENDWSRQPVEEERRYLLAQSKAICTQIISNLYALNGRRSTPECARLAFDFAERSQSRSLLEQLKRKDGPASASIDPKLFDRDRELLDKISSLGEQTVLLRAKGPLDWDKLLNIEGERESLVVERSRLLSSAQRSGQAGHDPASPLTARQVQDGFLAAHPNTVILNYQLGVQESFLIVLNRTQAQLFRLPARAAISQAVKAWRSQILAQLKTREAKDTTLQTEVQVAAHLYDILVRPASNLIRGRDLIVISSDELNELAFEALVVSNPGSQGGRAPTYLVEQNALTYAPSASTLALIESRQEHPAGKDMLLVGDSTGEPSETKGSSGSRQSENSSPLTRGTDASSPGDQDWLPGAHKEVEEIASLARSQQINPTIWFGLDVNKQKLMSSSLSRFRFIHLAMHSLADYQDGYFSALTPTISSMEKGASILTSYEIADLKLDSDLVVLSGCETGVGQRTGAEGIISLTRTFLIAGSRCVCGSLWSVEDDSSEKLMREFYNNLLAEGLGSAEALRQAKMALLHRGANPSRWAAFVLVGSPR